jgi:dGTPase
MQVMDWNNCFSAERFGVDHQVSVQRTEYERDWDRLIFSSAFRRLQNKTQVFPLPEEAFVHNRLTHSLEVASVGRSLGAMVGMALASLPEVSENAASSEFYREHLKTVVATACLAHDLGNPAFGHSGEAAISKFFVSGASNSALRSKFSEKEWSDLISFEGNANALRILTRTFRGRQPGGFRLTYSTLAAMMKYPCAAWESLGKSGPRFRKKYGYFQAEQDAFLRIAVKTGMRKAEGAEQVFHRHPFVYLVEAADDICYNIVDLEDAHRLRIFSTDEVGKLLFRLIELNPAEDSQKLRQTFEELRVDANEAVSYLRAKTINFLTHRCAAVFLKHQDSILSGSFDGDLLGSIDEAAEVLNDIRKLSREKIYNHPSVVRIELAGYRIMSGLVEDMVTAALTPEKERTEMDRKTILLIKDQYRFEEEDSPYEKVMAIFDFISGMTDLYALRLYRHLRGMEVPSI